MGISLRNRLYLMWLGIPVAQMQRVCGLIERNGLGVTMRELIAHHRVGGDVGAMVNGLLFARERLIPLTWTEAAAIDLAGAVSGKRLPEALMACVEVRTYTFGTFSPEDSEPLAGFTGDGTRIEATYTLRYCLTPQYVFGQTIEGQHEKLAVRIAVLINKASDPQQLEMARTGHQQALLSLCAGAGVQEVWLEYRRR